ncbi:MAG: hypothetical protein QUS33_08260 [Dehalococcoidia bacterium]|nr:hypothetical protein [Dehalococcoidia bacterium]
MIEVASGENLASLQTILENYFGPGEPVTVAICLDSPVTEGQISQMAGDLRASGVRVFGAQAVNITWSDGQIHPGILLSFQRPSMAPADKISFWPVIILAIGAVGALGYIVYKGGEISEDFVQGLMKLIFPLALLGAGTYIIVKVTEKRA